MIESKLCKRCGITKKTTDFYECRNPRYPSERIRAYCKICSSELRSHWYHKQGGKELTFASMKRKSIENSEFLREKRRIFNWNAKITTLNAYGGKCVCCNITEPKFLAIDHINGGGKKHRKSLTINIYAWLKNNNYPEGFRVLCHNCNMATHFWKICPHNPLYVNNQTPLIEQAEQEINK